MRLFLALAILAALSGCAGETTSGPTLASSGDGTAPVAAIKGMKRGTSIQVPVTLNNPRRETIRIQEISMTVVDVDTSGCPHTALSVLTYPKPIIGPEASGVVLVTVGLDSKAPEECDGTAWRMRFLSRAEVSP